MSSDKRCYIRPKPGAIDRIFGPESKDNILYPLRKIGKLLFPYTPEVTYGVSADYEDYSFTHTIYKYPAYNKSSIDTINVTTNLSAQTQEEARHMLATIHFFKVVTKSDFGEKSATPGSPPPILLFNYMGDQSFNNVPVVIKTFTISYPKEVSYIEVADMNTTVPVSVAISFSMDVFYNPDKVRKNFTLDDFAQGKLYKDGFL